MTNLLIRLRRSSAAYLAIGMNCLVAIQGADARSTSGSPGLHWSLSLIAQAPTVSDLVLSSDGRRGLYLVREAAVGANLVRSSLWSVDLRSGQKNKLLTASRLASLEAIPNSSRWSILADLGAGIQLYAVDPGGKVTPIVVRAEGVTVGVGPTVDSISGEDGPQFYGVLNYGWSPDGSMLWYASAHPSPDSLKPGVADDPLFFAYGLRNPINALHVLTLENNRDQVVDEAAGPPEWQYTPERIVWSDKGHLLDYQYVTENADGTRSTVQGKFDVRSGARTRSEKSRPSFALDRAIGPGGGLLSIDPAGNDHILNEHLPSSATRSYGVVDFRLASKSGNWRLPDGTAIVAIRHVELNKRDGLVRVSRDGAIQDLDAHYAVHDCAVAVAAGTGLCIQEGMNLPPRLAIIDTKRWRITKTIAIADAYERIAPLHVEPRLWVNRNGIKSTGFIVYPRDYFPGTRYPSIVVTHGSDADQRFVSDVFQWQFPVQLFAERGYVVICLNNPITDQNPQIRQVYAEWIAGHGALPPSEMQRWIWLEGVTSLEDIIAGLDREGLIDRSRLGIAGYSAGSQRVNVTVTHSHLFKAASTGDGGYPEPTGYWTPGYAGSTYKQVYGGSPYDPRFQQNYRTFAPSFRAAEAKTAVLSQVTGTEFSQGEFSAALKNASIPSEVLLFPRESHLFHVPANRILAMTQNLDWFDFWLLGKSDDRSESAQYIRWSGLRDLSCRADATLPFCQRRASSASPSAP